MLVDDASGDGIDDIAAWSPEARGVANVSASRRGETCVILGAAVEQFDLWHSQGAPSALVLEVPYVTSPVDAAPNLLDDTLSHYYGLDAPAGVEATIFITKQDAQRTIRISWLDGAATGVAVDPSTSTVATSPACVRPDGRSASVVAVTPRDAAGDRIGAGLDVRPSAPDGWLPGVPTGGFRDMGNGTYELEVTAAGPGIASITVEVEGVLLGTEPVVTFEASAPLVQASAIPRTGPVGTEFAFSATVTNGVAPFVLAWDLDGDGLPDTTGAAPSRTFASPGNYCAVVTATDSAGCTGRASVFITVER